MSWAVGLLWLATAAFAQAPEPDKAVPSAWQVRADELQWAADGRFTGRGIWATRCTCADPPWAIRADELSGELGDRVVLRGATIEVCGKPLLPIPWMSLPLKERHSSPRLPQIGHTGQGWRVAQPVFLALGSPVDLTLAPEWRSEGVVRLLGDATVRTGHGPDAQLMGAVGQETRDGPAQGMADARVAVAVGQLFGSVDSTWISDPRYLSDYSVDYLGRSAPWTESLVSAGVGPVRLESDTFGATRADAEALAERPMAGVFRMAGQRLGPLSADLGARVDMVTPDGKPEGQAERMEAAAGLFAGRAIGPAAVEARLEGRSIQWADATAWHQGQAWGAARLGLWGDVGGMRHVADVGLEASRSRVLGTPEIRLYEDRPAPLWSVGPALRSHWLSPAGVPIALEAALPWTPDGLIPGGSGRVQLDRWGVRLAGSTALQEARTWWRDERLGLGLGAVRYGTLVQGQEEISWVLPAPAEAWRPGWRGLHDLSGGRFLSQGPTLGYDSPCDCLRVEASAAWSEDRARPEFWVHLDLR